MWQSMAGWRLGGGAVLGVTLGSAGADGGIGPGVSTVGNECGGGVAALADDSARNTGVAAADAGSLGAGTGTALHPHTSRAKRRNTPWRMSL
jgi:hypothetical protein